MENFQLKHLADLYLKDLYTTSDFEPPVEYQCCLTDDNDLYITWTDYGGYKTEYYVNIWEMFHLLHIRK